jgi:hypothetical protein
MKNFKKWTAAGAVVLALGLTSVTAFAAVESPAEIVAGLTGKSVEAVIAERTESGKTYGTLAADAGKLEEFQLRLFEEKKARVEERVQAGTMTEERAEAVLAAMETRQANCDGTGSGNMYGEANGNGNGVCDGTGDGVCDGTGSGSGSMNGGANGNGACDGTGDGVCDGTNGNGTGVCDGTGSGNASGAARGNRASGSAN